MKSGLISGSFCIVLLYLLTHLSEVDKVLSMSQPPRDMKGLIQICNLRLLLQDFTFSL